jgi:hypothetical protein
MAGQTRFVADLTSLQTEIISNEQVKSDASIESTKLEHFQKPGTNFGFVIGGTPTAREEIVFVASQACSLKAFHCLLNDTGTSTDIDFDLKKNGTTVLSSVVNITEGTSDGAVLDGTLSSSPTALATDDIISISMAVTSSTGAQGPFAWAEIEEVGV